MPAVIDFIKEAVRDGSLKPDELFSALPVEYRDHITVLYLKTLDSEDILDLLCFSTKASTSKKKTHKQKKKRTKKKRPKKKKSKGKTQSKMMMKAQDNKFDGGPMMDMGMGMDMKDHEPPPDLFAPPCT